jgi:uncharacterized protein YegP (UPF0339 family)
MRFVIYSKLTLRGRRWGWRLKARNGEILAVGAELFNERRAARESAELVRSGAIAAPVMDEWA